MIKAVLHLKKCTNFFQQNRRLRWNIINITFKFIVLRSNILHLIENICFYNCTNYDSSSYLCIPLKKNYIGLKMKNNPLHWVLNFTHTDLTSLHFPGLHISCSLLPCLPPPFLLWLSFFLDLWGTLLVISCLPRLPHNTCTSLIKLGSKNYTGGES